VEALLGGHANGNIQDLQRGFKDEKYYP